MKRENSELDIDNIDECKHVRRSQEPYQLEDSYIIFIKNFRIIFQQKPSIFAIRGSQ